MILKEDGCCFQKFGEDDIFEVIVGSQSTIITEPSEFTVSSIRTLKHEGICLLEVPNLTDAQPEACNDCWSPVCLPQNHVEAGTLCYVAGWGENSSFAGESEQV